MSSSKDDKELFPYFDMGEAWDDVIFGDGAKEKTVAGLKFLGKGLFNTGKFAVKTTPKAVEILLSRNIETANTNIKQINKRLKDKNLSHDERFALEQKRLNAEQNKTTAEEALAKYRERHN